MRLALPISSLAARAALLVALAACQALPIPLAAQPVLRLTTLEPYVSRVRVAPDVVGGRTRLSGAGARLLYSVGDPDGRLRVGGYLAAAPVDAFDARTTQFGAVADLSLRSRPFGGRVEPILSLGAGAFRADRPPAAAPTRPLCVRPLDLARAAQPTCFADPAAPGSGARARSTHAALGPALAARVSLAPGLALRVDARDLVVFRGRPRHGFELTTGVSLTR
jgi:hypothetical protein